MCFETATGAMFMNIALRYNQKLEKEQAVGVRAAN